MQTNILKAAIFTPMSSGRWGLPVLCWGQPGVGKTAVIEEICSRYGMPCETLSPSERGEGAFGVVPVPGALTKGGETVLTFPRPDWTEKFVKASRGVVFVDEATSTPPALQAALMGLILARRIGGYELPKGVRILAAANPPDQAAGGFDLAPPVANRFGHFQWEPPTVEEHTRYMLGADDASSRARLVGDDAEQEEGELRFDASEEEGKIMKAWPNAWSRAVGLETAFLARRSSLKNMMPKMGHPGTSRAWPSDRTWEMATRAYASAIVNGLSQTEQEQFVAGFISEKVASEWFAFMELQDLPDPSKLLDGKEKFKHESARVDRTLAVLQACTALVTPPNAEKRQARAESLWKIVEKITEDKADFDVLVPSVQALVSARLHAMKAATGTLFALSGVLRAANFINQGDG